MDNFIDRITTPLGSTRKWNGVTSVMMWGSLHVSRLRFEGQICASKFKKNNKNQFSLITLFEIISKIIVPLIRLIILLNG